MKGSAAPVTVELPAALRPYASASRITLPPASCATVGEALALLATDYPGVVDRIVDEQGTLRAHVNVFVGEESVRHLDGLRTAVGEGSVIVVVPAVSGG